MLAVDTRAVLEFWFAPLSPPAPGGPGAPHAADATANATANATTNATASATAPAASIRREWFRKDAAFDAEVRSRFAGLVAQALAGGLGEWCATPEGSLARVLVLDQFTRNAHRDTAQAFAGDARARATAADAIERGFDRSLRPVERWFMYMPFEHSESQDDQQRSLALFRALADETGLSEPVEWAERHAEVIRLFGRFPHRNTILGRASSPEETEFLRSPGSRF